MASEEKKQLQWKLIERELERRRGEGRVRLDYGLSGARGPADEDGCGLVTRKGVQPVSWLLLISEVEREDWWYTFLQSCGLAPLAAPIWSWRWESDLALVAKLTCPNTDTTGAKPVDYRWFPNWVERFYPDTGDRLHSRCWFWATATATWGCHFKIQNSLFCSVLVGWDKAGLLRWFGSVAYSGQVWLDVEHTAKTKKWQPSS